MQNKRKIDLEVSEFELIYSKLFNYVVNYFNKSLVNIYILIFIEFYNQIKSLILNK